MERLGVRGKWFVVMGLIFSLMVWWAAGLVAGRKQTAPAAAPEAKKEEAPAGR